MVLPAGRLALLSFLGIVPLLGVSALAQAVPKASGPAATTTAPAAISGSEGPGPQAQLTLPPLPLAPEVKGQRPRLNPRGVAPASTEPDPSVGDLPAPDPLALPTRAEQVMIRELRPLTLAQVENLAELNNPDLKAIASQVDQAQSSLRAQLALWYPSVNIEANALPAYNDSQQRTRSNDGSTSVANSNRWAAAVAISAQWALINPGRNPTIAAARDTFERERFQYVIALRNLRLQAAELYFDLQQADDQVRIGQESVRASLVSLRDSRARFQAGVATKLEVLEAETQLARDQQLLTSALATQSVVRRELAALLDLPQNVTPTAQDPSRVLGVWQPSLQESIVAAYAFREELDQVLLNISIANSQANAALAGISPSLNIIAGLDRLWFNEVAANRDVESGRTYDANIGLRLSWTLFDGGRAAAEARVNRQFAQENTFRFAQRRDALRQEVETSFFELEANNRNITTTAREVISAREALRLARLRFQAGVTTQREVVDNQRDLTQAEVRFSNAITDYNKRLAQLRRRTGLDQIVSCPAQMLPAVKPVGATDVPVEPTRLLPACQAANPGPL